MNNNLSFSQNLSLPFSLGTRMEITLNDFFLLFAVYSCDGRAAILNGNKNQSIDQTSRTGWDATDDGNYGEDTVFKSHADI